MQQVHTCDAQILEVTGTLVDYLMFVYEFKRHFKSYSWSENSNAWLARSNGEKEITLMREQTDKRKYPGVDHCCVLILRIKITDIKNIDFS